MCSCFLTLFTDLRKKTVNHGGKMAVAELFSSVFHQHKEPVGPGGAILLQLAFPSWKMSIIFCSYISIAVHIIIYAPVSISPSRCAMKYPG